MAMVTYIGGSRPGESFLSADGTQKYCPYNESIEVALADLEGLLAQTSEWEAADEEAEEYVPEPQPGPFSSARYDHSTKVLYERDGTTPLPVVSVEDLGDPSTPAGGAVVGKAAAMSIVLGG